MAKNNKRSMFDPSPRWARGVTRPTTINISPEVWELGKKRGINMSELCRLITDRIILKGEPSAQDIDLLGLRNELVDTVNEIALLQDKLEGLELMQKALQDRINKATKVFHEVTVEALYMEYVDIIRRNLRDFDCDTDFVWEVTQDIRKEMKLETGRTITRDSLEILAKRVKKLLAREISGYKSGRYAE